MGLHWQASVGTTGGRGWAVGRKARAHSCGPPPPPSVNESAQAEPPEQACEELLPLPRAQGEWLCTFRLCSQSSCCSRMGPDVLLEPGRGSERPRCWPGQEKMLLPLGSSGSAAHLGPEPGVRRVGGDVVSGPSIPLSVRVNDWDIGPVWLWRNHRDPDVNPSEG